MEDQSLRAEDCAAEHRSIGAEGCAAERNGASEHRSGRAAALDGVEHRSGGLRSGEERSIGAEGCAAERSGASERSSAAHGVEHRSGGLRSGAEHRSGGLRSGAEHRSGGLRSGAEWSIGAEEMEWSLILAPLLLWPHLFAGIFVTEQEAMGHKAVDSFQEHALKVFGFAMFVAKLLSHDGLRKARSLQQRQAMNKE